MSIFSRLFGKKPPEQSGRTQERDGRKAAARQGGTPTADTGKLTKLLLDLNGADPRRCLVAIQELGRSGDPGAVEPLIGVLKNKTQSQGIDYLLRSSAADSLGTLADKRAVEILIASLKDENSSVRSSAARALGDIGDGRAVEALMAALQDEVCRRWAAYSLGKIGDPKAIGPLEKHRDDADEFIREEVQEALYALRGDRPAEVLDIFKAAAKGDTAAVKGFLENGADVNAASGEEFGDTALMLAAREGHYETVELLLAKGADPKARGGHGITALMFASAREHGRIVELLLAKGAYIDAVDQLGGWSALTTAAKEGKTGMVKLLLAHGANVHTLDNSGRSALMAASEGRHDEIVKMLRQAGAVR